MTTPASTRSLHSATVTAAIRAVRSGDGRVWTVPELLDVVVDAHHCLAGQLLTHDDVVGVFRRTLSTLRDCGTVIPAPHGRWIVPLRADASREVAARTVPWEDVAALARRLQRLLESGDTGALGSDELADVRAALVSIGRIAARADVSG